MKALWRLNVIFFSFKLDAERLRGKSGNYNGNVITIAKMKVRKSAGVGERKANGRKELGST